MSALTEIEIFNCLSENFKLAAEHCEDLAKLPAKGPTYKKLIEELKLIEGACRQAGYWRQDDRWFRIGIYAEECHKKAGGWLRTFAPSKYFLKLAEALRAGHVKAEEFKTKKTGQTGMLLTELNVGHEAPLRHQPISVILPKPEPRKSPGGIIIPSGVLH